MMLGAVIAALMAAAGIDAWPTYTNVRYGFSICYPSNILNAEPEPPNSDGHNFRNKDGAQLIAYGSNDLDGKGAIGNMADSLIVRKGAGAKITYRASGEGWEVASGVHNETIFYEKVFERESQIVQFSFSYPANRARDYNPIVQRIAGCFRIEKPGF